MSQSKDLQHIGLGTVASMVGLTKSNLMEYVKLGAGAAGAITATDLILSRILVRNGQPVVPAKWSPLAIAALSVVLGRLAQKKVDGDLGLGMIAGGVGVAVSAVAAKFMNPSLNASAAAAEAAEASGAGPQMMAGFGLGRAFAPAGGGAVAGVGRSALYGVGTPDMSAAQMFGGATVAIEDGGPMAGATVQFEEAGLAGTLN